MYLVGLQFKENDSSEKQRGGRAITHNLSEVLQTKIEKKQTHTKTHTKEEKNQSNGRIQNKTKDMH